LRKRGPRALAAAPAALFWFSPSRGLGPAAALVRTGGCPRAARGRGCVSHTRGCRVPPHFIRRLGRSAPQSTGLTAQLVKVTHGVNGPAKNDHIVIISADDPVDPPREFAPPTPAISGRPPGPLCVVIGIETAVHAHPSPHAIGRRFSQH